ncbi:MFS transporter [Frondihabitans cladoniiphilus]|uniref:MFS transporter n=1 Tax=Frondihabitans cladoniiphilus TaxID=715785 RepID=A0ABP8VWF1_9MICO
MSTSTDSRTGLGLTATIYVFAAVMIGTTLPTPLYPTYESVFGFGSQTTTVLFAIYAAGVIVSLLVAGRLSQSLGRRPVLLIGAALSLVSAILFTIGTSEGLLFVGRVFSGLSAGVLTSTGTVAVLDAAPDARKKIAGSLATAANIGGLGFGMIVSGLVAGLTPFHLRGPFVVQGALVVIAGLALLVVPETVAKADRVPFRLHVPTVPAAARGVFGVASIGAIAGFAVCGLFSSVAPNFVGSILQIHSAVVVGLATGVLFVASAVAQIALGSVSAVRGVLIGSVALFVGMAVLALALPLASLALLIVSAVVSGAGQGLLFTYGLRAITGATPEDQRAQATTAYFIVAYLAISIPSIVAGVFTTTVGLTPTGIVFAGVMAVLCVVAFATRGRFAVRG